ncbi:hypothetical protein SAMN04488118_10729 [Epibacterium ulvae]|uniref:Uncharacterized protein n=1 Tax=Epibacterium ulvae TaxID=1156985 RepID=A0A1G5R1U7_9RHOB|nr:hypothetical protein [Epibacterium ulvae]SCZ67309.1 hypothetical protein SAMN04488118_10729 [Epibacterium ulvae]
MIDPNIKLLTNPVSSKAEIEKAFMEARVQDGIFPAGAFRIALPKLWGVDTAGEDIIPSVERPVVPIARFTPGHKGAVGSDLDAKVVVYGAYLERVLNGADWLRAFASSQGWSLVDLRELPTAYGLMGDAVALSHDGRLHRMLTIKDGNHLFLVDGSARPDSDPKDPMLQEIGLLACSRFSLLSPSGRYFAEEMTRQSLQGARVSASFLLPVSWTAVEGIDAPRDGAALHFIQHNHKSNLGTLIAVLGGDRETHATALEAIVLDKLSAQGAMFMTSSTVGQGTQGDFEVVQFEARWQERAHTVLSLRGRIDGRPVSIQMISATSEVNIEQWAVNRRVFDIVAQTLSSV